MALFKSEAQLVNAADGRRRVFASLPTPSSCLFALLILSVTVWTFSSSVDAAVVTAGVDGPRYLHNRVKRSYDGYGRYHYGGVPTDVGGSGYPPYYVGRKSFPYTKSKYTGHIPFKVRIFMEALASHTEPIVDVG
jgi:hypothetical protein